LFQVSLDGKKRQQNITKKENFFENFTKLKIALYYHLLKKQICIGTFVK